MNNKRRLVLVATLAVGCSSGGALPGNDGSPPSSDSGPDIVEVPPTSDASDAPSTNQVWPDNATKMVAEDMGGGFVGPAPTGSACPYLRQGTFTLTKADKVLAWHVCQAPSAIATGPYQYVDGSRPLNDAQLASLVDALNAVTVSTQKTCGADKETLALTVTTPAGDKTYLDDFYACNGKGVYVSNIDPVFAAARTLMQ
ncbi:MAG TPA: hypothetical protein VH374_09915 [Polyangia bacterium]|jgi:hypothetical protein|nr:hypothetical protein [Polyangia bacterium]